MLGIAIAGLLANLLSFWLLHRGSEEKNLNVRAAALARAGRPAGFGRCAIVAAVIIHADRTGRLLDPILSLLVALLVLRSAWALLRESLHELLEGAPDSHSDVAKLADGRSDASHCMRCAMCIMCMSGRWARSRF